MPFTCDHPAYTGCSNRKNFWSIYPTFITVLLSSWVMVTAVKCFFAAAKCDVALGYHLPVIGP
jgi:hypothetical protein